MRGNVELVIAELQQWLVDVSKYHSSLSAWVCPTDGRRRTYPKSVCPEITCSRYVDAVLHALPQWAKCVCKIEVAYEVLEAAVGQYSHEQWIQERSSLVEAFMMSLLELDLMGLKGKTQFSWEAIQVYPLKFIFSDVMGRLRVRFHAGVDNARCLCQTCVRVQWIERTYTFFGPSPRGLLHCLLHAQRCSE